MSVLSSPPVALPPPAKSPLPPSVGEPDLLAVPAGFCLRRFVEQSPAPVLPPVVFDADRRALQFVVYPSQDVAADAQEAVAIEVLVCQAAPGQPLLVYGLPVEKKTKSGKQRATEATQRDELKQQIEGVLGLDEDFSLFYAMCQIDPGLRWVADVEGGRCLRSPRVFEDLVKCLLRPRLPAAQVAEVCALLCQQYGPATTLNRRGFPTAQALAKATPAQLERKLRIAALVAKVLHALIRFCSNGQFFAESLRRLPSGFAQLISDADDDADADGRVLTAVDAELEWQLRVSGFVARLPGFGERACALLYPLIGCHSEPSLDIASLRLWQSQTTRGRRGTSPLRARTPEADAVAQRILNRVGRYAIYAGLAQRLLLQDPPGV